MRYWLVTVFVLLMGKAAQAQINESDTLSLQYRAALTGNVQSGNLEALTLLGRFDLSVAPTGKWALKTQNNARYQAFFGRKADNDFNSQNFVYLGQQKTLYPFAMAFAAVNFRRKVRLRWFAGPGLTWQVWRGPGQVVKLSLAGVYEATEFDGAAYNYPEYNGIARIKTWRATARVFGQHRLQRLRVSYEAYVQPSLERANNFRWLADLNLEMPVWRGLNLNAHVLYTHENVVVEGVKTRDMILSFGLSYRNLP